MKSFTFMDNCADGGQLATEWSDVAKEAWKLGFCAIGMVRAGPVPPEVMHGYLSWLKRRGHAGMTYLEKWLPQRANPTDPGILDGADAVIVVAMPYGNGQHQDGIWKYVARHARGKDYHQTMKRRLNLLADEIHRHRPGVVCRVCVDSAPVMERTWAVAAGLGRIGRNGALLVPGVGPRVLLGEIICRGIPNAPMAGWHQALPLDAACDTCRKCVDACPTGALSEDGQLDAARCISYQTVEQRGEEIPLDVALRLTSVFGCDRCTSVCPVGRSSEECALESLSCDQVKTLTLEELMHLRDASFSSMFKETALFRTGYQALLRNALHCVKNRAG